MGPVILARGLAGRAPYAVKVHGSALEYTVRPHRERFLPYALEGVRGAGAVLVGSRHTAESLWEVLADEPSLPERTGSGRRGRRAQLPPRPPAELPSTWPAGPRAGGGRPPPGAARRARPTALRSLDPTATGSSATWAS